MALPFYVHETGFRGRIYATSAVLQFGRSDFLLYCKYHICRLVIEEMIEFFERITVDEADPIWKYPEIFS